MGWEVSSRSNVLQIIAGSQHSNCRLNFKAQGIEDREGLLGIGLVVFYEKHTKGIFDRHARLEHIFILWALSKASLSVRNGLVPIPGNASFNGQTVWNGGVFSSSNI